MTLAVFALQGFITNEDELVAPETGWSYRLDTQYGTQWYSAPTVRVIAVMDNHSVMDDGAKDDQNDDTTEKPDGELFLMVVNRAI